MKKPSKFLVTLLSAITLTSSSGAVDAIGTSKLPETMRLMGRTETRETETEETETRETETEETETEETETEETETRETETGETETGETETETREIRMREVRKEMERMEASRSEIRSRMERRRREMGHISLLPMIHGDFLKRRTEAENSDMLLSINGYFLMVTRTEPGKVKTLEEGKTINVDMLRTESRERREEIRKIEEIIKRREMRRKKKIMRQEFINGMEFVYTDCRHCPGIICCCLKNGETIHVNRHMLEESHEENTRKLHEWVQNSQDMIRAHVTMIPADETLNQLCASFLFSDAYRKKILGEGVCEISRDLLIRILSAANFEWQGRPQPEEFDVNRIAMSYMNGLLTIMCFNGEIETYEAKIGECRG